MNLDDIKKCILSDNLDKLSRTADMEDRYKTYQELTLKEWISVEDYIKVKYFGAATIYNEQRMKYSLLKHCPPVQYTFQPNDFPYDTGTNVKHYVLWSLKPLSNREIDEILHDEVSDEYSLVWFEQTYDQKSIKDIWHIHVFVE